MTFLYTWGTNKYLCCGHGERGCSASRSEAPVLHLLAMRDRGHANAGGIHECLNFCLYSNPPPPVLFVMQNFYCLGWGELEGAGIQPGSLGWTLGDRHGTNAGWDPPLQIWARWEEQMVTMQKCCFLSRVLGSTVSTAVMRIICAWMAASFFSVWK